MFLELFYYQKLLKYKIYIDFNAQSKIWLDSKYIQFLKLYKYLKFKNVFELIHLYQFPSK